MNLSHLYYFKKLVEVQHYTRAAKELYISQPTLSAAISQLEKELGAPLFQKHTRAVRLTPYGQDFYRHVSSALDSIDKGTELVQQRAGRRRSSVHVGSLAAVQDERWAQTIKAFRDSLDMAVTLDIRQDRTPTLLTDLRNGRYDVVFTGRPSEDPNVISVPYSSLDLVLAVNKKHSLARRESVSLEQLQPYHLLSYAQRSSVHTALTDLMERHGLNPDMAYSDSITMCSLVSADVDHMALVTESFLLKAFDNVALLRLDNVPDGFHPTYLCYRDEEFSPEIVKRFVEFFLDSK